MDCDKWLQEIKLDTPGAAFIPLSSKLNIFLLLQKHLELAIKSQHELICFAMG